MIPTRLTKMLARQVMVSWRDEPTRYDIEALQANTIASDSSSACAGLSWPRCRSSRFLPRGPTRGLPVGRARGQHVVPALALLFVLRYNTFYQLTYKRLGNIAILNHAQLIFDVLVVTVLVYYSGGVHSWFWTMYPLFILEAAFILPKRACVDDRRRCALASGSSYWGEYVGVLPHVTMPFVDEPLYHDLTFVAVRYLWQLTVLAGTATVATLMTGAIRSPRSRARRLLDP